MCRSCRRGLTCFLHHKKQKNGETGILKMEYLVIDGYNVINAWKDIFNPKEETLEDCRDKLLKILSNYQGFKKINIIVVFDAHMVKGSRTKRETFDDITVIFTKENETADNYIERFVYIMGETHRVRVVTSDYLEQTTIFRKGGIRMLPRELKEEIFATSREAKFDSGSANSETNSIVSRLKPEQLEKLEKLRRGNSNR